MKKALALILIIALLVATIEISLVSFTIADPYIPPEEAPQGYRIYGNGTCTAPNISQDGDVYTFTGDVKGTIVIERDGIVLDGAGYTLQGKGDSIGVWLQDRRDVTIKNLNIRNFGQGIRFSHYAPDWHSGQENPNHTTDCTIQACKITNNSKGITFYWCFNCKVLDNFIANNTYGVSFTGSGNTFRDNRIEHNEQGFCDEGISDNDVDDSNTVDGRPICYWINQHNMTVPYNAGMVILKQCSGIKVENLNLEGNLQGVSLVNTNESMIYGNEISNNRLGIALYNSHNNSIVGNQVTNNSGNGIDQYKSSNNSISNNLIESNQHGMYDRESLNNVIANNRIIANKENGIQGYSNCTVIDNYIFGNAGQGIFISDISDSSVMRNNLTSNKGSGIKILRGINGIVEGNYISKNNMGIWIGYPSKNTLMLNDIVENSQWGIRIEGYAKNNRIYLNNFVGNNNNSIHASIKPIWVYRGDARYIESLTDGLPQQVAGFANSWDNGTAGNYWSDYNPTAQEAEGSTIGDTPYCIDDNNQDNHPLLAPLEFAALELPSTEPPQETDIVSTIEREPAPFPITLAVASIAIVATAGMCMLVYFKKYRS